MGGILSNVPDSRCDTPLSCHIERAALVMDKGHCQGVVGRQLSQSFDGLSQRMERQILLQQQGEFDSLMNPSIALWISLQHGARLWISTILDDSYSACKMLVHWTARMNREGRKEGRKEVEQGRCGMFTVLRRRRERD